MNYAYLRSTPGLPSLSEQVREVVSFAQGQGIMIDREVVEYSQKEASIEMRKEFESFLKTIKEGDYLVVAALEVLSKRAEELVKVIDCIFSHKATLGIAGDYKVVDCETKAIEIFSMLNAMRQKTSEPKGKIGRPKGSKSNSKFDIYRPQIIAMLKQNMSVSAIARELDVSRSSLKDYIDSRALRDLVGSRFEPLLTGAKNGDHIVMICPFEQQSHMKKVG